MLLNSSEKLDSKWFHCLMEINPQLDKRLTPLNYENAKKIFLCSSNLTEPSFLYPETKIDELDTSLQKLSKLKEEIINCNSTTLVVKEIYFDKIDEIKNQFLLLKSLKLNKKSLINNKKIEDINEIIYQKPDKNVFFHLCQVLMSKIEEGDYFSTRENNKVFFILQNLNSISSKHNVVNFEKIFSHKHSDAVEILSYEDVVYFVKLSLHKAGLNDWEIGAGDAGQSNFRIRPRSRIFSIPSKELFNQRFAYKPLRLYQLEAIVAHELSHAIRASNGSKSCLQLLGVGLAGYHYAEEGIATYRSQLISFDKDYPNQSGHFAACIAYGIDRNNHKRTFKEVYDILIDYYRLFYPSLSYEVIKDRSFNRCHRIFKYCTTDETSFVFFREFMYREGNILIHNLLSKKKDAHLIFNIGKFNPSSNKDVCFLKRVGLISSDYNL